MAVDFDKVAALVTKAKEAFEQATEQFGTPDKITPKTAYLMGCLRSGMAVCDTASLFAIQAAKDSKGKS